ncbi:NADP-dependent oxidoreductase [Scytonema hofmannii PCC 7110]|uniref:NADP-dependent oxidoreductase n=1 Tax=Scytonema hofmannii PCC 7110 TaxID=128403 RepID=A0A139X7T4_9CYAN|nr:NADP-dependent oxidoreductase [Scytonema hofmannii]KYC40771.1 NADP-dependent oxidoreductase [Scytonema hofmannii PCC 7110]
MTTKVNRQWCLATRPVGAIAESNFEWKQELVPSLEEGQILVRNIYLSLDPTNRGWLNEGENYLPPVAIGEVMRGFGIGIVEQSRNTNFPEGTLVQGFLGWQDYAIADGTDLNQFQKDPFVPLTAYLGLFGFIGMTAYFGLLDIGKPKAGEMLVVSGAAGAVGSLVGQIGKIKGCRVIGIAGSEEKCHWLKDELGFDAAINYKTESVLESLQQHCPNGIDIYFENVGGEILDAVLSLINLRARIVLCGLISQYNATEPVPGPYNFINIVTQRAKLEGFIVLDYFDRAQEALADLGEWYAQGKIQYRVDVIDGLENAPSAINKLFDGTNQGKLIIKVSEE